MVEERGLGGGLGFCSWARRSASGLLIAVRDGGTRCALTGGDLTDPGVPIRSGRWLAGAGWLRGSTGPTSSSLAWHQQPERVIFGT